MNTVNGDDVAKIIHAMDEEFMRNLAARDVKQLTANFPSDGQIGFIYKGKLFVSGGLDAGEPL